ncbi:MAG: TetR/AcrR family transcriptional regulator [Anaerolineae bacterium]
MLDNDMPNRFERHKQRTRQLLMRATLELISEKGYEAVSVLDITERADLGRGTFYLHFKNKEDILWLIMEEYFDRESAAIDEQVAAEPSPRREFLSWVAFFENVQRHSQIHALIKNANSAFLRERISQYLLNVHERNLRAGRYSAHIDLPPDFQAAFASGATLSVVEWWMNDTQKYSAYEVARMFYRMVYRQPPPEDSLSSE